MHVQKRSIVELEFKTKKSYENPFLDVELGCRFTSPSGKEYIIQGFYDGDNTWKVRFSPDEVGVWSYKTFTQISDPDLTTSSQFEVTEPDKPVRGFLKACAGRYWGLEYESSKPCFIFGDTMYNLFGVAHSRLDVETVLKRRAQQGFNLIRVRVPVSPFHPPRGYNDWQTKSCWPWTGSPQKPVFDRFNLEYFRTVDNVMHLAQKLGIGFEMIIEAWGFEYPFNQRTSFLPEYEELWIRYLIARYDAFSSLYVWTLMNEYELYPNGNWHYTPEADLWAIRVGKFVKNIAPHGHLVAIHNGPEEPPFAQRFKRAPNVIDLIMFQTWGTREKDNAWLAAGIENKISHSLKEWEGASILAEYGYERNPSLELKLPSHEHLDPEHTRRGVWRGAFCGIGVIHGFENTWGPWWIPEEDQEGMKYLLILKKFFMEEVEFHHFRPDNEIIDKSIQYEPGTKPLCMSASQKDAFLVYLPVGGSVALNLPGVSEFESIWYNPRTGGKQEAQGMVSEDTAKFEPASSNRDDWTLVLRKRKQG